MERVFNAISTEKLDFDKATFVDDNDHYLEDEQHTVGRKFSGMVKVKTS